ncbi:MAG: aspartyl protease family protein [Alphaproteobacteria bacterium]|jgi:aspartyl protease family protein
MNETPNPWDQRPQNEKRGDGRRKGLGAAVFLGVVVVGVLLLYWRFPQALDGGGDWASLGYVFVLLAVISFGFSRRQTSVSKLLRQAGVWLGIILLVGLFYAYRYELSGIRDRLMGEFLPGVGQDIGDGEVQFRAGPNGHFQLEARVNGVPIMFLLDTGASDIVLDPQDAVRLGFKLDRLTFSRQYQTANGVVRSAPVNLDAVQIGAITIRNVDASVNGAPLGASLLGMSFLERLSGYSVENGTLVLRQ